MVLDKSLGALGVSLLVVAALLSGQTSLALAQSCDAFDECTTNPVCQPDGTCKGTPKANGTGCDDGNPCTRNDSCQGGSCHGVTDPSADGKSCTSALTEALGQCVTSAACQFGFCIPDFKECPDADGNKCTVDFCNPSNGQCTAITTTCEDSCSTGQCDPGTGSCTNLQPKADNLSCDDFNSCTSGDHCSSGECVGSGGSTGPTATRTPTSPGGQSTRTPTPTVAACVGDCNDNGEVTVVELMQALRAALEQDDADDCNLDRDLNGQIDIDELVAMVTSLQQGCPVVPTVTPPPPSATPTQFMIPTGILTFLPTTPAAAASATPTRTGGPSPTATSGTFTSTTATRAAGTVESASTLLIVLPDILSAVFGHVPQSSLQRARIFTLPVTCPDGGGGTLTCDQTLEGFPPRASAPVYGIQLQACKIAASSGATLTFNGTLTLTGADGDTCGTKPSSATVTTQNLTIEEAGSAGSITASFSNFSAAISPIDEDDTCGYRTLNLGLTGQVGVSTKNSQGVQVSSVQASFAEGSTLLISVDQYGEKCVPEIYSSILSGNVTFATQGTSFVGVFTSFTVSNDTTEGNNRVSVEGFVSSACLAGDTVFSTRSNLILPAGASCPIEGEETLLHGSSFSEFDVVRYTSNGVEFDYGDDETIDASVGSCLDPRLYACAAN